MIGSLVAWSLLALAVIGSGVPLCAQETDPGRAPTGAVTQPGDLLKEADGTEFRFAYFPSSNRLRLLVRTGHALQLLDKPGGVVDKPPATKAKKLTYPTAGGRRGRAR